MIVAPQKRLGEKEGVEVGRTGSGKTPSRRGIGKKKKGRTRRKEGEEDGGVRSWRGRKDGT
jgi:hypothetical protein